MAQWLFSQALAPSTLRTYHSARARFVSFCGTANLQTLPITQSCLCRFVTYLASDGVAHRSKKCYLSALRHWQISTLGYDPNISCMPTLSYVLQGVQRAQACSGSNKPCPRLPITAEVMRLMKHAWEAQGPSFNRTMLWAVSCTCFFGFLRSGEATVPSQGAFDPSVHLSISDVALDSPTSPKTVILRIKASKTDPFRAGVNLYLGKTDSDLCPVAALLAYIHSRGTDAGPLFRFEDGTPLTRVALVRELRSAISHAGVDPSPYSGHSFRIGAATTAAAVGIQDNIIKMLGRWQSSAYQAYVKMPRAALVSVSSRLAASQ